MLKQFSVIILNLMTYLFGPGEHSGTFIFRQSCRALTQAITWNSSEERKFNKRGGICVDLYALSRYLVRFHTCAVEKAVIPVLSA